MIRNPLRALVRLAHRCGISPLMMRNRRRARERGGRLRFGIGGVHWERGDFVILLPAQQPYRIPDFIAHMNPVERRAVPVASGRRRIIDLRGPVRYRLPSGRDLLLPQFPEEIDTCAGYLARGAPKSGDIAVDAGAFCGEIAIELALLVGPSGRVFALEPDPQSADLLRQNLAHHGLDNVTLLPHALWDRTMELTFSADGDYGSALHGLSSSPRGIREITVSALSPADLFARIGRIPDFIKMDIEGAEVEVVAALAPLLAAAPHPVRLSIASYHLRDGQPTHALITPVLRAAGLQVETGNPEHVTTWASRN